MRVIYGVHHDHADEREHDEEYHGGETAVGYVGRGCGDEGEAKELEGAAGHLD